MAEVSRDEEPAPLEVMKANFRKPRPPTKARIAKHPYAVILLAWAPDIFGASYDTPADRDMEQFDTLQRAQKYMKLLVEWARGDWDEHRDMSHGFMLIDTTGPNRLEVKKIQMVGSTSDWRRDTRQDLKDNPEAIFAPAQRERIEQERNAVKKGKVKKVAPKRAAATKGKGPRKARNTAAPDRKTKKGRIQPRMPKKNGAKK